MIKILIQGEHPNTYFDGGYLIETLTSSVTLIKTGSHNMLVDTGALSHREKLISELKNEGIEPEDVDIIFNTHFHLDHVSNNTVFFNAKQYSEHAIYDLKTGKCEIFSDRKLLDERIPEGIEYFETPGHFKAHMSLLYGWEGKKYVIAGDVIREDIIRGEGHSANGVSQALYNSMKLIFEKADVIIPGHGRIIEGKLFDELKNILLVDFPQKHGLKS